MSSEVFTTLKLNTLCTDGLIFHNIKHLIYREIKSAIFTCIIKSSSEAEL